MSQGFANPYNAPGRLIRVQILTGSGTYTPTTGTVRSYIEALGAGGAVVQQLRITPSSVVVALAQGAEADIAQPQCQELAVLALRGEF